MGIERFADDGIRFTDLDLYPSKVENVSQQGYYTVVTLLRGMKGCIDFKRVFRMRQNPRRAGQFIPPMFEIDRTHVSNVAKPLFTRIPWFSGGGVQSF